LSSSGILAINVAENILHTLDYTAYERKLASLFKIYKINAGSRFNYVLLCSKQQAKEEIIEELKQKMQQTEENFHILKSYLKMSEV